MAHANAYTHVTQSTIPKEAWDEAWFTICSWKGYLQSFPGFLTMRVMARALENGDVRFHSATVWEYPEQMEAWRESKWSAESLLRSLSKPAYDITEETYEDYS